MREGKLKKTVKHFFSIIAIVYSIVLIVFFIALIVTKLTSDEFLIPIIFKIILLYLVFSFFIFSVFYYIMVIAKKDFSEPKILFILIINNLLTLVGLWDPFSLVSFFLG